MVDRQPVAGGSPVLQPRGNSPSYIVRLHRAQLRLGPAHELFPAAVAELQAMEGGGTGHAEVVVCGRSPTGQALLFTTELVRYSKRSGSSGRYCMNKVGPLVAFVSGGGATGAALAQLRLQITPATALAPGDEVMVTEEGEEESIAVVMDDPNNGEDMAGNAAAQAPAAGQGRSGSVPPSARTAGTDVVQLDFGGGRCFWPWALTYGSGYVSVRLGGVSALRRVLGLRDGAVIELEPQDLPPPRRLSNGGGADVAQQQRVPGELRLCGLTFHPELAAGVSASMQQWEDALTCPLSSADPAKQQLEPVTSSAAAAGWEAAFTRHGLRRNILHSRLATLLGLSGEGGGPDAPLPEGGCNGAASGGGASPQPLLHTSLRVAPAADGGRASSGSSSRLEVVSRVKKSGCLGLVGGYVAPRALADEVVAAAEEATSLRSSFAAAAAASALLRECRPETCRLVESMAAEEQSAGGGVAGGGAGAAASAAALSRLLQSLLLPLPESWWQQPAAAGSSSGAEEAVLLVDSPWAALLLAGPEDTPATAAGGVADAAAGQGPPEPNCMVLPVRVRGLVVLALVAVRDVEADAPLVLDRQAAWWGQQTQRAGQAGLGQAQQQPPQLQVAAGSELPHATPQGRSGRAPTVARPRAPPPPLALRPPPTGAHPLPASVFGLAAAAGGDACPSQAIAVDAEVEALPRHQQPTLHQQGKARAARWGDPSPEQRDISAASAATSKRPSVQTQLGAGPPPAVAPGWSEPATLPLTRDSKQVEALPPPPPLRLVVKPGQVLKTPAMKMQTQKPSQPQQPAANTPSAAVTAQAPAAAAATGGGGEAAGSQAPAAAAATQQGTQAELPRPLVQQLRKHAVRVGLFEPHRGSLRGLLDGLGRELGLGSAVKAPMLTRLDHLGLAALVAAQQLAERRALRHVHNAVLRVSCCPLPGLKLRLWHTSYLASGAAAPTWLDVRVTAHFGELLDNVAAADQASRRALSSWLYGFTTYAPAVQLEPELSCAAADAAVCAALGHGARVAVPLTDGAGSLFARDNWHTRLRNFPFDVRSLILFFVDDCFRPVPLAPEADVSRRGALPLGQLRLGAVDYLIGNTTLMRFFPGAVAAALHFGAAAGTFTMWIVTYGRGKSWVRLGGGKQLRRVLGLRDGAVIELEAQDLPPPRRLSNGGGGNGGGVGNASRQQGAHGQHSRHDGDRTSGGGSARGEGAGHSRRLHSLLVHLPPPASAATADSAAPRQPGELRLCGLTFHPQLVPFVYSEMRRWEDALTCPLSSADPAKQQLEPVASSAAAAGWEAAFTRHGLRRNILHSRLATLLGLSGEGGGPDAPLPEGGCNGAASGGGASPQPLLHTSLRVAPAADGGRASSGSSSRLEVVSRVKKSGCLGLVGGYVAPRALADEVVAAAEEATSLRSSFAAAAAASALLRECRPETCRLVESIAAEEQSAGGGVAGGGAGAAASAAALSRLLQSLLLPLPESWWQQPAAAGSSAGAEEAVLLVDSPWAALLLAGPEDTPATAAGGVPDAAAGQGPEPNCMVLPVRVRGLVVLALVAVRDVEAAPPQLRQPGAARAAPLVPLWRTYDSGFMSQCTEQGAGEDQSCGDIHGDEPHPQQPQPLLGRWLQDLLRHETGATVGSGPAAATATATEKLRARPWLRAQTPEPPAPSVVSAGGTRQPRPTAVLARPPAAPSQARHLPPPQRSGLQQPHRGSAAADWTGWDARSGYGPSGHKPGGHEPRSHEPRSYEPSGHKPSGHEPRSHEPSSHEPSGHKPSSHEPSGHEPRSYEPSGHKPSSHEPSGHKPSGHKPSGHEPRSHEPRSYEPSGHKPSSHEPSGHEPRSTAWQPRTDGTSRTGRASGGSGGGWQAAGAAAGRPSSSRDETRTRERPEPQTPLRPQAAAPQADGATGSRGAAMPQLPGEGAEAHGLPVAAQHWPHDPAAAGNAARGRVHMGTDAADLTARRCCAATAMLASTDDTPQQEVPRQQCTLRVCAVSPDGAATTPGVAVPQACNGHGEDEAAVGSTPAGPPDAAAAGWTRVLPRTPVAAAAATGGPELTTKPPPLRLVLRPGQVAKTPVSRMKQQQQQPTVAIVGGPPSAVVAVPPPIASPVEGPVDEVASAPTASANVAAATITHAELPRPLVQQLRKHAVRVGLFEPHRGSLRGLLDGLGRELGLGSGL
eukprot:XP_001698859.1 predicted protein [Chlamydomonas reinhardtii]